MDSFSGNPASRKRRKCQEPSRKTFLESDVLYFLPGFELYAPISELSRQKSRRLNHPGLVHLREPGGACTHVDDFAEM